MKLTFTLKNSIISVDMVILNTEGIVFVNEISNHDKISPAIAGYLDYLILRFIPPTFKSTIVLFKNLNTQIILFNASFKPGGLLIDTYRIGRLELVHMLAIFSNTTSYFNLHPLFDMGSIYVDQDKVFVNKNC